MVDDEDDRKGRSADGKGRKNRKSFGEVSAVLGTKNAD